MVEQRIENPRVTGSNPVPGNGASPSGKAVGFDPAIRRFESFRPSYFLLLFFMDFTALFSAVFISCFVFSLTVYSVYLGFGPGSADLRDPFEEHED